MGGFKSIGKRKPERALLTDNVEAAIDPAFFFFLAMRGCKRVSLVERPAGTIPAL